MGTDRIQEVLLISGLTFLLLIFLLAVAFALIFAAKRGRGPVGTFVRFRLLWLGQIRPDAYYPLIVFAYAADAGRQEPEYRQNIANHTIERHLKTMLGSRKGHYLSADKPGEHKISKERTLLIRPKGRGLIFDPPVAAARWLGPLVIQKFQVKAVPAYADRRIRGRIEIRLRPFFKMACMDFDVAVTTAAEVSPFEVGENPKVTTVFPSYSHKDLDKVQRVEEFHRTLNHVFTADWNGLHAGERWDEGIRQLIEKADKFQLFWSENAADSNCIPQEWKYAQALGKPFLPTTFVKHPPHLPEEIADLNFVYVSPDLRDWEPQEGGTSYARAGASLLLPPVVAKAGSLGLVGGLAAIFVVSSAVGFWVQKHLNVEPGDIAAPTVALPASTPISATSLPPIQSPPNPLPTSARKSKPKAAVPRLLPMPPDYIYPLFGWRSKQITGSEEAFKITFMMGDSSASVKAVTVRVTLDKDYVFHSGGRGVFGRKGTRQVTWNVGDLSKPYEMMETMIFVRYVGKGEPSGAWPEAVITYIDDKGRLHSGPLDNSR